MKLTLKQARDTLYRAVVPNLDTQEHIDRFNLILNFAVERLINSGSWAGMVVPVIFDTPEDCNRHITLPPCFESALAMRYTQRCSNGVCNGSVSHTPVNIRNQWFAFTTPGPFCWDVNLWQSYGFGPFASYSSDEGDGFCTFRSSPYASYYLRIGLENAGDNGLKTLIKGYDEDGQRIFTPSSSSAYEGVTITVSNPFTQTAQVFTKDIYFFGKSTTQGYITLDAVDTVTGEVTRIGLYWPSEVNACYHRYKIARLQGCPDSHVEALCKLRYTALLSDQDEVYPANLGALRLALAAIVYEENSDPARYEDYFQRALKLLNDELRSARGGAQFKLNISPGSFGLFNGLYPGR